jgi:hypothetical protein
MARQRTNESIHLSSTPRQFVMKNGIVVFGVILALAGLGLIGASVQSLISGPSSAVECHGEVMSTYDYCDITTNGSTVRKSYSELKDEKKSIVAPVAGIVFGTLVLLLGGGVLRAAYSVRHE